MYALNMEYKAGFDFSPENLEEARRIFIEDGEELKAICSEIEHSEPDTYQEGYDLERELRAQGLSTPDRWALLAEAGTRMVAKYLQAKQDSLDNFLEGLT